MPGALQGGAEMRDEKKVNVNYASVEELTRIPGVGPVLAGRLVAARPFDGAEDLRRVRGIGEASLQRIRPLLAFNEQQRAPSGDASEVVEGADKAEPAPEEPSAGGRTGIGRSETPEPKSMPPRPSGERWVTRGQAWWGIVTASVISILLSVAVTLSIMLAINGTLDVQRHQAVQGLQADISRLEGDLVDVDSQLTGLSNRMQALEGLSGRVTTLEGEMGSMRSQVQDAITQVGEMQSRVGELSKSVDDLGRRTDRVDQFLEGLRNLINGLDAGNGSSGG
jgi:competence ComEA-like helix-hairpin-helix protein